MITGSARLPLGERHGDADEDDVDGDEDRALAEDEQDQGRVVPRALAFERPTRLPACRLAEATAAIA